MISLAKLPSAFSADTAIIKDAILLMQNVAADIREPSNGIITNHQNGVLAVSYSAYKWALGFNVIIQDEKQVKEMQHAIETNKTQLQPAIDAYEDVCKQMSHKLHYDAEVVKRKFNKGVDNGSISEQKTFEEYLDEVMAPLQEVHDSAKSKVYGSGCLVHPNEYLQSLGLAKIRFESISPLYR